MKTGFLQQFKLADIGKTVELEYKPGVGAGGYATTVVLVVIHKLHP
jgi:hypothetical protein